MSEPGCYHFYTFLIVFYIYCSKEDGFYADLPSTSDTTKFILFASAWSPRFSFQRFYSLSLIQQSQSKGSNSLPEVRLFFIVKIFFPLDKEIHLILLFITIFSSVHFRGFWVQLSSLSTTVCENRLLLLPLCNSKAQPAVDSRTVKI